MLPTALGGSKRHGEETKILPPRPDLSSKGRLFVAGLIILTLVSIVSTSIYPF